MALIRDYKKSIVVCGDTKPIKDGLKNLGGKWNSKLNDNGEEFCGWVFSPSKRQEITEFLRLEPSKQKGAVEVPVSVQQASTSMHTRTNVSEDYQKQVLESLARIEKALSSISERQTKIEDKLNALDETVASWLNLQNDELSGEN